MEEQTSSLIQEAAKRGYVDQITEAIQTEGASVHQKDTLGNTPLHWAASGGHLDAVKYLLSAGAQPNVINSFGDTPLHRAAWKGFADVCQALIEHGAAESRKIKNNEGKLPIDLARKLEGIFPLCNTC
jgi:ankyrin repeat protein